MNRFDLHNFTDVLYGLFGNWYACELRRHKAGGGSQLSKEFLKEVKALAEQAESLCTRAGFLDASIKIYNSRLHFEVDGRLADTSSVGTEIRNILEVMLHDSKKFSFLQVNADRVDFINNESLLGRRVATAFPSALPDLKEAGNCLAAECNTAAVFHLMRAVEWGLRALCVNLGFRRLKSKIRNNGTVVYTPIEYLQWENILNQLHDKVDNRIKKLKKGKQKQELQEFYYPALQDIRGIRDAWRNHVMHARSIYTRQDADAALEHVRRIMSKLSTRVAEV